MRPHRQPEPGTGGDALRHRVRDPDATFHQYQHLMRPAGITRLADITGLDVVGIPVFIGVRPLARSLVISVGKGPDPASARTGALMEAIECWYAEYVEPELWEVAYRDIADRALDPATLPSALDEPGGDMSRARCDWIQGVDMGSGAPMWVPFEVVSLDYRCSRLTRPWLARNSNGLASGNTWSEAVLHAVCEVVETDAEWRWRTSDDSRRLNLDTVTDQLCVALIERVRRAGLHIAAWDVTSGIGIPCFGCVVMPDPDHGIWGAGLHDGFACHPRPATALAGALLEAVQKRLTYISGSRDDVTRSELRRATAADLARQVWDECRHEPQRLNFDEITAPATGEDTASQLLTTVAALDRAGFGSPVVVSLSESRDGFPAVVKAIVPGTYGPYGACRAPEAMP